MDLGCLLDGFADVVRERPPVEVDSDGMLAGGDVDNRGRRREQSLVLCKVANAEGRRHDDQSQRLKAQP